MFERLQTLYHRLTSAEGTNPAAAVVVAVIRWCRVFYKQLLQDKAFTQAAGMGYMTLVALVPVLLLLFGLLDVTGALDDSKASLVQSILFEDFLGDIPQVKEVLLPGIQRVDLSTLGLVGVGGLLFISLRLYMLVESAYNDIFGVVINRSYAMRLVHFWVALTVVPLVVVLVLYTSVDYLGGYGQGFVGTWASRLGQLALLVGALKFLPCTPVRWRAAVLGGGISWVLMEGGRKGFELYLLWFKSDDPLTVVYGSLGLIPVFLFWLYLVWVFVLLGVEVAYVAQNTSSLLQIERELEEEARGVHRIPSVDVALEVLARVHWRFETGGGPSTRLDLANATSVPARRLSNVIAVLESGGLLLRDAQGRLIPARPAHAVRIRDVVELWRARTDLRSAGPHTSRVARAIDDALLEAQDVTLDTVMATWAADELEADERTGEFRIVGGP
jgi:membrane protein